MLDELGIKIPESEEQLVQDPFLMLGYGVNAYFDIMFSLVIMYTCITIFCLPIFHAYASNGSEGMSHYAAEGLQSLIGVVTLGNLGGSIMVCENVMIIDGTIDLSIKCKNSKRGYFDFDSKEPGDHANVKMGIMAANLTQKNFCSRESM